MPVQQKIKLPSPYKGLIQYEEDINNVESFQITQFFISNQFISY